MNFFVIDTSALLRLFIPDGPLPEGVEDAIRSVERGAASLLAPELLLAEAGQVLKKKRDSGVLTAVEMDDMLTDLLGLPIQLCSHKPILRDAIRRASDAKLTVYDAIFLVLAEKYNATLLTADEQLQKASRRKGT
jgi:predicted nucleic acid-binding protein